MAILRDRYNGYWIKKLLGYKTTDYQLCHDDVMKWKHFPRKWPFVRGIHRSPVNSPHKGQWGGALMFSLICAWINDSVNNREAGDLKRYRAHHCNGRHDDIRMVNDMMCEIFLSCGCRFIDKFVELNHSRSYKSWHTHTCHWLYSPKIFSFTAYIYVKAYDLILWSFTTNYSWAYAYGCSFATNNELGI